MLLLAPLPCVSITEEAKRLKDLEHADAIYSVGKILSGGAEMGINQGRRGRFICVLKLTTQTIYYQGLWCKTYSTGGIAKLVRSLRGHIVVCRGVCWIKEIKQDAHKNNSVFLDYIYPDWILPIKQMFFWQCMGFLRTFLHSPLTFIHYFLHLICAPSWVPECSAGKSYNWLCSVVLVVFIVEYKAVYVIC